MPKRQVQITLRLTPEEHQTLNAAAEKESRSLANFLRIAALDKAREPKPRLGTKDINPSWDGTDGYGTQMNKDFETLARLGQGQVLAKTEAGKADDAHSSAP